jgi:hypothetical protein
VALELQVAEGDLPIVASHGAEIELYRTLDPATRLVILKAICDIRCEQEDIRNFIDSSLRHGYHLPIFRKERIGGDSYGISYWWANSNFNRHMTCTLKHILWTWHLYPSVALQV